MTRRGGFSAWAGKERGKRGRCLILVNTSRKGCLRVFVPGGMLKHAQAPSSLSANTDTRNHPYKHGGMIPRFCLSRSHRMAAARLLSHLHFSSDLAADSNQRQEEEHLPRLVHHSEAPLRAHVAVSQQSKNKRRDPGSSSCYTAHCCPVVQPGSQQTSLLHNPNGLHGSTRDCENVSTRHKRGRPFLPPSFQPNGAAPYLRGLPRVGPGPPAAPACPETGKSTRCTPWIGPRSTRRCRTSTCTPRCTRRSPPCRWWAAARGGGVRSRLPFPQDCGFDGKTMK